jgi:hypothetical protein
VKGVGCMQFGVEFAYRRGAAAGGRVRVVG